MLLFSTLTAYGQNKLFTHEQSDKEDLHLFRQQAKFLQNSENEFLKQERQRPPVKQPNITRGNKQCYDISYLLTDCLYPDIE